MDLLRSLHTSYRATGADLPYGNPLAAHGVATEGYYWRVTDVAAGRVLAALIGVNRGPRGHWATLGLAAHPAGTLALAAHPGAHASRERLEVRAGDAFRSDDRELHVD